MSFDFLIPSQHPALRGHFPGQPIIPAALLLDELSKIFAQHTGQHLCSAKQLRFIAPGLPDQTINVEYDQKTASDYRFCCRSNGQLIAKGIMSTLNDKNTSPITIGTASISPTNTASLYQKLPHQGDICLIDNVTYHDSHKIVGVTKQPATCPLQRNGQLPSWASLEYAAQTLACHGLLRERNHQKSDTTFTRAWVIGVKYLNCLTEYLPQSNNMPYNISAHIIVQQPGVASYEFYLGVDNNCLAFGRMNVTYDIDK